jgi:predicted ATPase
MEGLPLQTDGLRFEDDRDAHLIGDAILSAYQRLGYAPVRVPAFTRDDLAAAVAERLAVILDSGG